MSEKPPHLKRRIRFLGHTFNPDVYSWSGAWVLLRRDGGVEYSRCTVCDRPLSDEASRSRGVGLDCLHELGDVVAAEHVAAARLADRYQWVYEHRRTVQGLPPFKLAGRLIDPHTGQVFFDPGHDLGQ